MRISDWSSDVCSSDLSILHDHRLLEPILPQPGLIGFPDRPAAADEGVRGQFLAAVRDAVQLGIVATAIDGPRIVGDAPPDEARARRLLAAADRDVQIGRASCRERVCQYV